MKYSSNLVPPQYLINPSPATYTGSRTGSFMSISEVNCVANVKSSLSIKNSFRIHILKNFIIKSNNKFFQSTHCFRIRYYNANNVIQMKHVHHLFENILLASTPNGYKCSL